MKSLIIAFSMYSKIPMPHVEWDEKSMKYVFCFFPLVGVIEGLIIYFIGGFLLSMKVSALLRGCIFSVLPILFTGGIHMDGFLDTCDGLSSYQSKERRLEILKDSNSGAFAIIGGLVYMTLSIGFGSEINVEALKLLPVIYVLSRAFTGLSVIGFKQARKKGLAFSFSEGAEKKLVGFVLLIYILATVITGICISPVKGVAIVAAAVAAFIYHYYNCMSNFGGITGDLAGYFLEIAELLMLIVLVICS